MRNHTMIEWTNDTNLFAPPVGTSLTVTGSDVNCRATPCTDGRVITTLQINNKLSSLGNEKTACGHTWWNVRGSFGDGWVASQYLKRSDAPNNLCFPLKANAFLRVSNNWGDARSDGARCHAGIDIYTKSPGHSAAVEDGVVTGIFNFLYCNSGWGGAGQSSAVLVYHTKLDKTFNYGEIDTNKVAVRVGQQVKKGQNLGVASHCGMLHFEVYRGRQTVNFRWSPPAGRRVTQPGQCHREFMSTKPSQLEDPRPWVNDRLRGKFC